MKETAPCPWCTDGGRPFLHLSRKPFMSYTMRCNNCYASGPHVIIKDCDPRHAENWASNIENAQVEATKKWNSLSETLEQVQDDSMLRLNKAGIL